MIEETLLRTDTEFRFEAGLTNQARKVKETHHFSEFWDARDQDFLVPVPVKLHFLAPATR